LLCNPLKRLLNLAHLIWQIALNYVRNELTLSFFTVLNDNFYS
jgi:hypothetical protein